MGTPDHRRGCPRDRFEGFPQPRPPRRQPRRPGPRAGLYAGTIEASLRLRPDRIIVGELRGKEAFSFLRAVNTGHPGSITTVHADTPRGAIDQIAMLSLLGGLALE